jgi:hypothetical protein
MLVAFSPPVMAAAIAGAVLVARVSPARLVLLLPIFAHFLLLVLPTRTAVLRYLLPLTLIVDAFAASAVVSLRDSRWRPLWLPVAVLLIGWRLAIAVDLTYAQQHDTRYAAAQWLKAHVRATDRIEFFGVAETLPPLPADLMTRRIAGRTRWVGEVDHAPELLRYLGGAGPEFLVIIPDWTSKPEMPHSGDCPPDVYTALMTGAVGYTQVAYFPPPALLPASIRRPPLDNPSVAPPVRVFARHDTAQRRQWN